MKNFIIYAQICIGVLLFCSAADADAFRLQYLLTPIRAKSGVDASTHVEIVISGDYSTSEVQFQMPVWSPGDYYVQNHGNYVTAVTVRAGGSTKISSAKLGALEVTHPNANTWSVSTAPSQSFVLSYTLPNTPPGHFSENVSVKDSYAFYNGAATFMYVVDHKDAPATLSISVPTGWQSAFTPLPSSASPIKAEHQIGRAHV